MVTISATQLIHVKMTPFASKSRQANTTVTVWKDSREKTVTVCSIVNRKVCCANTITENA